MVRGHTSWGIVLCLGLLSAAGSRAQEASAAPANPPAREYAFDLLIAGQLGLFASRDMDDGVLFGGTTLLRHSILTAGATFHVGGGEPESSVVHAALLGGLSWQTELGVRFDLLGSFGVDAYHAESRSSFLALDPADDPGTSAAIACAGARAGAWYRFAPRGTGHFIVGAFATYEQDLDHVTKRYSYVERSFLDSQGDLVEVERRFGDRRLVVALTVGLVFDLLPR